MGGKAIKKWTGQDKAWLRSRFYVDIEQAIVYLKPDGDFEYARIAPIHKVGPERKQYLAVSAKIGGKWTKVRLHMLVWFFATGEQSLKMIDHVEGCPTVQYNNRFDNLREATDKQNCANKASRGFSMYLCADGVVRYFARISWTDRSTGKVKTKRSKLVDTAEEAVLIYRSWKKQRFGKFAFDGDVSVSSGSQLNIGI